ncbi:hypothetical protein [Moorena producens]|uniref:hypothetical protein n=1 Tax=Moorena producens TaxID=1155739 RepID=UPI003C73A86F
MTNFFSALQIQLGQELKIKPAKTQIFLLFALSLFIAKPACADPGNSAIAVKRVSLTSSGQSSVPQNNPIPVALAPGYGVNISFISTGEVIEKLWIDNPSFVAVDVDGCLDNLVAKKNCEYNQATVIHLRRIEELDIPGIPKTNSTLLTVVTRSINGRQIYLFKVTPADRPSEVVIEFNKPTPSVDFIVVDAIERGIFRATLQGLLVKGSQLHRKLDNFVVFLKDGQTISNAATQAGISLELADKLQKMGRRPTVPTAISQMNEQKDTIEVLTKEVVIQEKKNEQ